MFETLIPDPSPIVQNTMGEGSNITKFFIFIFLTFCFLQGCVDTAVTGTVSGAQMTYNRYNIKKAYTDQVLTMRANNQILHANQFKNQSISVSVFNQVALMTGQVSTPQLKIEAEKLVRKVESIKQVYNVVVISPSVSPLTQISDAWITTKIKTQLIASNDIDPSQIKVITENGIVYLFGIIPPDQADAAVTIARTTAGVQHVVKVFSYMVITNKA